MHILITGGAGFIGTHLTRRLLARGDTVSILDNLSTGSFDNIREFVHHPLYHFAIDTLDSPLVLDRLASQADAIVHLAAAVGVQLVVEKPTETIETNVLGTHAVLNAARRYRCRTIIASTSEVYGKGVKIPFSEEDDLLLGSSACSRWSYAASKLLDEFMGLAAFREYGLPATIVRFFNTVGPGQTGRYGMVVPRFVRQAIQDEAITVYGDGNQSRCFCHVSDTTRALELLLDRPESTAGEIYNIGTSHEVTINELAGKVIARSASASTIRLIPYNEAYAPGFEDMRRRVPDTSKIRAAVGWQATRTLTEILDDVIAYERASLLRWQSPKMSHKMGRTLLLFLMLLAIGAPSAVQAKLIGALQSSNLANDATSNILTNPSANPGSKITEADQTSGPALLKGKVTYTNPFFTVGVAEPLIVLEDEAGFVDRNPSYLISLASQTLGQITSDFLQSPFSYTLELPIEPQGALRDVYEDGSDDPGVMVFAVADRTNKFGDPFLEERDLYGGGWSTAYASTRVTEEASRRSEVIGGKLIIYAPTSGQGFPSGFGADGLLFTADDPITTVETGYSVVNLDTRPFTFDRNRYQTIDLIEPDFAALQDYSQLGYAAAFDALIDTLQREYAFTSYKGIDWQVLASKYRPLMAEAEAAHDRMGYLGVLRDFSFEIPDGHVQGLVLAAETRRLTDGGIGLTLAELDDGLTIAAFLTPSGPAASAGMRPGDLILAINDQPIADFVANIVPWNGPFSTEHTRHLQQLRYATRFEVGAVVKVTFTRADRDAPIEASLTAISERDSFDEPEPPQSGFELPLRFERLANGYVYVQLNSFFDNEVLTIQLWERLLSTLNRLRSPGVIIDLRDNGGGSGFLADQMAAYFFEKPLELGNTAQYNAGLGDFYFDPRTVERYFLPAANLRYDGPLAVIIGPECASACEFFAYDLTLEGRAATIGHYPTAGLGGSISQLLMPEQTIFQYTSGRAVDMNGNIHIEGKGVPPTIRVPVTAETVFDKDALLNAAIDYLDDK